MANLRFLNVITIRSNNTQKYFAAEKDGSTKINRDNPSYWERFLLLNPTNLNSSDEIKTGDEVCLLSYHNYYLVCEPDGTINCNRDAIGSWEHWKIYNWNTIATGNLISLNDTSSYISLKAHTDKFASSIGNSTLKAFLATLDSVQISTKNNQTALLITKSDWTNFHYGISLDNPQCPSRGRYDGANCFIAKPPEGNPFIYHNNLYYTTNNRNPILGWWDGANAQVGQNSDNDEPFIYNNAFYLKSKNTSYNSGILVVNSQANSLQVCVNAVPIDGGASTPINLQRLEYIKICYKKYWALFTGICKKNKKFENSRCGVITSLESGKLYSIKVYLKYSNEVNERVIGTKNIRPQ